MDTKRLNSWGVCLLLLLSQQSFGVGTRGQWMGSGGMGQTFSPRLLLIQSQIEQVVRPNLFVGGLFQLAALKGTLGTVSFTTRLLIGDHPQFRPYFEVGVGLAAGNISSESRVGVLLHSGVGIDFWFSTEASIGTLIRFNFAPPLSYSFVSLPFLIGRFLL